MICIYESLGWGFVQYGFLMEKMNDDKHDVSLLYSDTIGSTE